MTNTIEFTEEEFASSDEAFDLGHWAEEMSNELDDVSLSNRSNVDFLYHLAKTDGQHKIKFLKDAGITPEEMQTVATTLQALNLKLAAMQEILDNNYEEIYTLAREMEENSFNRDEDTEIERRMWRNSQI